MSFKDLNLHSTYNSAKIDIVKEFYIPVLSEAKSYDRVVGYFNSYSLALIADGLKDFISHNGKMRLLCGTELNFDDEHAILNASDIAKELSENFLNELEFISDDIQMNRIKLLAWMVDNDILDIKVGIVKDDDGYVGGILHEKTGILSDGKNTIVFTGSNNETKAAMSSNGKGNIEKFKVFLSWEDSKFMDEDIDEFHDYWNNIDPYLEVIDIPTAAKNGLIKYAPSSLDEVIKLPLNINEKYSSEDHRELRDYQKEAISNWIENGSRGIFKMATGTGKTFTALNCISESLKSNSKLITIIACPFAHLVEQWGEDIKTFFNKEGYKLFSSANPNWKKDLSELSFQLKLGIINEVIILTTHNTLSHELFKKEMRSIDANFLLIVDEVHNVASSSFRTGLLETYDYRLGLSATPEVYNNEEGTDVLMSYFGGIVFNFDLYKASTTYGEDGETFLAPYKYFPKRIGLSNSELENYLDLSDQISKAYRPNKKEQSNYYKNLLSQRKAIINNADEKFDCLIEILQEYDDLDHLIVFCSPQQIKKVLTILNEEGIKSHKFTQDEGTKKSKEFGGLSQREFLVKKFDEGVYKSLVAIKCLDEGVDIPSADKVIIMASSNNPKEYVQRRGRVLRRYEGKKEAVIYDMAVIEYDSFDEPIESIVENEKKRLIDFINLSSNPTHGRNFLQKWRLIL